MSRNNPRSANIPPPEGGRSSTSSEEKSQARQAAARLAQDRARRSKRTKLLLQSLVGLVVVVAVVAVTVVVLSNRDSGSDTTATKPAEVSSDGSFTVGKADAKVTIQMVEDFQCPICKEFEATNAALLASYAANDDVKLEYRGIAFLDKMSSTTYSTRALNASACVMPQGAEVWSKFHTAMYEQQPPEQGDGLTDAKIIDIATTAGADASAITSCIEDKTYAAWTKSTTQKFFDAGGTGTPTIFVNGTQLKGFTGAEIKAAVDKALAA